MDLFAICRMCLNKQDPTNCKRLIPEETYNDIFILSMIKLCIPELAINQKVLASICMECLKHLDNFHNFKRMCLINDLKYSNTIKKERITESNNSCQYVPFSDSDMKSTPSNSSNMYNNCFKNIDSSKTTMINTADVNQNVISEIISKKVNTEESSQECSTIKKRSKIYRNKFLNDDCAGCKNRILDVKYHNRVFMGYYDCLDCGKRFSSIAHMRKHVYTHTLRYTCHLCGKRWRDKYMFDIHLRSHTKQKPFECPVCNKKFVQSYSLHQHMALHQGRGDVLRNKCLVCGKTLSTKYNLKIHMTTHNDDKPRCPKCNRWFYTQVACKKHIETCSSNIAEEGDDDDIFVEPEFIIKTELLDSIKREELESNVFLESPQSIGENMKFETFKSEYLAVEEN